MDSSPLVSVIIPCYNGADYVAEAIESALAQTHASIEVLVVDDGSTDGSPEILKRFANAIRWKPIPNSGACQARNTGLGMANGAYIQFLDADDLLMPDKIERQLPLLLRDEADLVFCKGTLFGDGKPERPKKRPIASPCGQDPFAYALRQGMSTPAPLHRRALLERIGGFRPGMPCAQELDLHVRLAAAGARIALLDAHLVRIRNHASPGRITQGKRHPGAMLEVLLDLERALSEHAIYEMTPARKRALAATIGLHAAYAFRNGARPLACAAFQIARSLDPHFVVAEERAWYHTLARTVGHANTERLLNLGRQVRDRLAHATP